MKAPVVVITGGTKGLGLVIAQLLILKGHQVVICSRNKEEVESVAVQIGATSFVADISKERDVSQLAKFVISTFGCIDVWINNAGVWSLKGTLEETSVDAWRGMFDVNVFGTMYGSKAALRQMRAQNSGTLVNIISSSALTGKPTFSGYAASKWAVRGFTESIREEYRDTPLKIVGVYPGGIKTHLFDGDPSVDTSVYMTPESVAEKIVENFEKNIPEENLIIRRQE